MKKIYKSKLSIIIVAYKNILDIKECLDSLIKYEKNTELYEVIIVDNSEDSCVYNFVKNNFYWVKALKSNNNGFGAGNNLGFLNSSGDYILFLNPDTIIISPFIEKAINYFENNIDIAYWGVQLLTNDMKKGSSIFMLDKLGLLSSIEYRIINRNGIYKNGRHFISGACLFIRRTTFIEAKMFDENIFMYHEESDLIHSINKNCKITKGSFNSSISIIHKEGKTVANIDKYKKILDRWFDSEQYYCKKYKLNIKKRIKAQLRYEIVKKMLLIYSKEKFKYQKEVVNHYKTLLNKVN